MAALFCSCLCVNAQSNKGVEFWTAWMDHVDGATGNSPSRMNLYLVSTVNTSGTVSITDGSFAAIPFTLIANEPQTIAIPAEAYLGESTNDAAIKKGIHIVSNQPIAAYAHIYRGSVSGATLLLPVNTMGKEYYSINYTQLSNSNIQSPGNPNPKPSYSVFNVIATEDATTVEITPKAALISGQAAGAPYQIVLNKGEVYQGLSSRDLTGTTIRSISSGASLCKKIVVFSGSSKIGIGCNGNLSTGDINATSDNLFQQVYPTETWGKNYYAVPLKGRNYDIFRIIYSDVTAQVTIDGTVLSAPTNGYYEFTTQTPVVVKSDKPIQLVQYTSSQNATLSCTSSLNDVGDPEMIFLPPIEQGLKQVTLYSPNVQNISPEKIFINVIIPASAASSFRVDGQAYSGFAIMPGDASYMYAQIYVGVGKHNLSASGPFNAVAYGFGQNESYGYAAGTNLQNLNEFIDLGVPGNTTASLTSGCANNNYSVQLAVPYNNLSSIKWNFTDGTLPQTDNAPQYSSTRQTADGTTLYIYRYNGIINRPAGYYGVIASIPNQGSTSGCGPTRDIEFYFSITDYPEANFTTSTDKCSGANVQFTDASDTKGSTIVNWSWVFNDPYATASNPNTSTVQNPTHTFTVAGNYLVRFKVVNENGCESVWKEINVHINSIPVVKFKASTPNCETQVISFTDESTTVDGIVNTWSWNFGDANSTTANPNTLTVQNPSHIYSVPGTYTVTLQVTTSTGCTHVLTRDIIVNPLPKANFTVPDACVDDVAKFTNTSTIADGSESQFTYEWDFNDPLSVAKTFTKDGVHKYSVPGVYKVTLKVISKDGCVSDIKEQDFMLNGANPTAVFDIVKDKFCSSENLEIKNSSSVGTGSITRYQIYYDYEGHPNDATIYDATHNPIPTNNIFAHNYGLSTQQRTFKVKIFIYSGASATCMAEYPVQEITVYPNPEITVTPSYIFCQEEGEQTLATDEGAFIGKGTPNFSGAGIIDAVKGIFDTRKAGPGTHIIHYTFTLAGTSCPYETDIMVLVNPTPIINGKKEYTIQAGESVTIEPQVLSLNGTQITYTWTPKLGLNNPAGSSPVASPNVTTEYTLTAKSINDCVTQAKFTVKVVQQPIAYNTFTPNGDGVNDTWVIPNILNFPKATVEVFKRDGEKVFQSVGYPMAWDGRYRGVDLPAGTYFFIIDTKNGKPVQSGPLTIIR
ncbi:PKD domain-containing protein [Mucilaginibacter terrae]|uniref:Gliding motility-associated-like protein n=1 Tax=Mucilaginibacter terrae TaxID=1955052 RepID=A0ABU3GQ33_9SPHI|nr:PKD domain-containing protein [Mucilaginibacter terrae]MDT3401894.1 gliding motility-associated-like protein [Mucilaginibacter terrae]